MKPTEISFQCNHCRGTGTVISKTLTETLALFDTKKNLNARMVGDLLGIEGQLANARLLRLTTMKWLKRRYDGRHLIYNKAK